VLAFGERSEKIIGMKSRGHPPTPVSPSAASAAVPATASADTEDDAMHQPHDKLVQSVFADIPTVAAFFEAYLSPNLASKLDLDASRIKRLPTRFLSRKFKSTQADLLFNVPLKAAVSDAARMAYIYVLLEHQSSEDKHMGQRLLDYMMSIWNAHIAKTLNVPLPLVVGFVLAQGRSEWRVATTFGPEQFGMDAATARDFGHYVPTFTYEVLDLAKLPYSQMRGTALGRMLLRVLKAWRDGKLLGKEVWDEPLIKSVERENPDLLERFFNYILSSPKVDSTSFETKVRTLNSKTLTTKAMSAAEEYEQRGRQEGLEKGELVGRIHLLQELMFRKPTPRPTLLKKSLDDLNAIFTALRARHPARPHLAA
jgi:hypothetical protein